MEQLVSYVSAIHGLGSPVRIRRRERTAERWEDQGFEVRKEITTYLFDNGVVIRRTVEQDDFPSDLACAECWICYEVVERGQLPALPAPTRLVFNNACRESFWLAYHRA